MPSQELDFADRVVWVTGGGGGIGAAVAKTFARAGSRVVIGDIDEAAGKTMASEICAEGGIADAQHLDVTDANAVDRVAKSVVEKHGGLDHVIACAGTASRHTIGQMTAEIWRRVIDVNLTGAFLVTKAAAPAISLRGGGSITIISSVAAEHIAYLSGAHYAASKAGLTGFVRHAAFELGVRQLRVNAVGPGPMSNGMGGNVIPAERRIATGKNLPLQRVVEPEDVANVCLFLASPLARAVTGVYLPVDSGFLTSRAAPYAKYFEVHGEKI